MAFVKIDKVLAEIMIDELKIGQQCHWSADYKDGLMNSVAECLERHFEHSYTPDEEVTDYNADDISI